MCREFYIKRFSSFFISSYPTLDFFTFFFTAMVARFFKYSVGVRMIVIAILTLVMLIPVSFVEDLISERESRRTEAFDEVSSKWGAAQTFIGPMLEIPYKTTVRQERQNEKGATVSYTEEITDYIRILPEKLTIRAEITPETRYRGIYKAILYRSNIRCEASFATAGVQELGISAEKILWAEAALSFGISDLKGVKQASPVRFAGSEYALNPGLLSTQALASGVTVRPNLENVERAECSMELDLNGSFSLNFAPVGRETEVFVKAPWRAPSFVGAYLPESREVQEQEFSARWKVLHLNRPYPQVWAGAAYTVQESVFGVKFLPDVDEYQKTYRTAKYAVMFLSLTFLAFFVTEALNKRVIHPIQYVLIGFGLVIFYTLLLSFSEHISFNLAYGVAAAAITGLITLYTRSVLGSVRATFVIFGILTILYGFLFIILQLQDYALLLGSIGLFVILAAVMYVTRNIDWFAIAADGAPQNAAKASNDNNDSP